MTQEEFDKLIDKIENILEPYGLWVGFATGELNEPSIKLHIEKKDNVSEHGILGQPTLRFINGECDYICNPKEINND